MCETRRSKDLLLVKTPVCDPRLAVLYLLQKTSDLQSLMQIENMFFKKAVNLMVNEVTLLIFLVSV